MGARGIANVGSIIEDDSEESEEEKRDLAPKQRQFVSLIVKNKSEPISIYEIVRICYVWWPVGESNPCFRRERAMS